MENNSVWQNKEMPEFPSAVGYVKTDVLIIGGGIAGLLTAYLLKQNNVDCVVAERDKICRGVTSRTTAKLTFQHGLIYSKIFRNYGAEKAKMYLEANRKALLEYEELSRKIDCGFKKADSFIYSRNNRAALEEEVDVLKKIGYSAELCDVTELPFPAVGAVKFKNQATFDPLKFLSGIAASGLKIYEHTHITGIEGHRAVSSRSEIAAKKIIVCTHFPFINRHGSYFLKMYQSSSDVLALKNAPRFSGIYMDENKDGFSFRNYQDYLLIGGGNRKTGQPCRYDTLIRLAKTAYPEAKIKYLWHTEDCMTLDSIPYIGNYSALTPNLYVACGFNKWGMTSAMAAARILCNKILDKPCGYAEVFSPSRSILKKQLWVNIGNAAANLCKLSTPRCPHMGCALKWNSSKKIWECPCHGSSFSEDGELIENPSNRDLDI